MKPGAYCTKDRKANGQPEYDRHEWPSALSQQAAAYLPLTQPLTDLQIGQIWHERPRNPESGTK
ncbi:hypothetical protein AGMMS49928_21080 [Spirochaetia bacterium]|nr:hypothetical protein AGMMS49928_21080 [Spirochaetia bacterium]